jgi:hypothetical protein
MQELSIQEFFITITLCAGIMYSTGFFVSHLYKKEELRIVKAIFIKEMIAITFIDHLSSTQYNRENSPRCIGMMAVLVKNAGKLFLICYQLNNPDAYTLREIEGEKGYLQTYEGAFKLAVITTVEKIIER